MFESQILVDGGLPWSYFNRPGLVKWHCLQHWCSFGFCKGKVAYQSQIGSGVVVFSYEIRELFLRGHHPCYKDVLILGIWFLTSSQVVQMLSVYKPLAKMYPCLTANTEDEAFNLSAKSDACQRFSLFLQMAHTKLRNETAV